MNALAEKIAAVLGSTWVIGLFGLWTVAHAIITKDYVATISDLAIEIGFLILRAESVQGERMEKYIKETRAASKKDLAATKRLEEMLGGRDLVGF